MRMSSQGQSQINGWSTVVNGLMKRPPTQHVAQLSGGDLSSAYIQIMNRSVTERYIAIITAGNLQVFDLAGNAKTVNFPYGKAYLNYGGAAPVTWARTTAWLLVGAYVRPTAPNGFIYQAASFTGGTGGNTGTTEPAWPTVPGDTVVDGTITWQCFEDFTGNALTAQDDFSAVTVADYTFVLNKTVTVQMQAPTVDQTAQPDGYFNLSRASLNKFYGQSYTNVPSLGQYPPNPPGTLTGTVQSFDYLPWPGNTNNDSTPSEGAVYEVQGDVTSAFTSYYVIWQGGVYNETVKPGLSNSIDASTMPWALIREANGTFTFAPFSWAPRKVGDAVTNPPPSFVGRQLRDVFFYQNRLGLCCDENAIMSKAGDFGNYFRLTVTQLLPDDVIDIGASETSVTFMNFAVPFATGMMLFSDQTEFRLMTPIAGALTPTTVALDVATRYLSSATVRPIMLGSDVYFVSEDSAYAHIREYFVKLNYLGQFSMDATDITAHVPKYIPKGVFLLTGSLLHEALFCATSAHPTRLYVYQFYWLNEQQKGQSAWHYWDFGAGNSILSSYALDDFLYILINRSGSTFIEKINLALGSNVGLTDTRGNLYDILLDRRVSVTGTYQSADNTTLFDLPYTYNQAAVQLVSADGATPGALSDPTKYQFYAPTQLKVPGNVAGTFWVGEAYTFSYQFSQQFMPNQKGDGVLSGRLTLRNWTVDYVDTAYFQSKVDSYGNGQPETLSFITADMAAYTGLTLGETALQLGTPTFGNGQFSFGVFGQSTEATITLLNDTPYSCTFVSAEWEADYVNRSRTI
jgi:hypothetical protein